MKRRHFISLSCLGALGLGSTQYSKTPPSTANNWKSLHKVVDNRLQVQADQLVDCISQLSEITGSPVRSEGNNLIYMEQGKRQNITIALIS